jgi:hypothetical protein
MEYIEYCTSHCVKGMDVECASQFTMNMQGQVTRQSLYYACEDIVYHSVQVPCRRQTTSTSTPSSIAHL